MPLGAQLPLGPGDIVLDGEPALHVLSLTRLAALPCVKPGRVSSFRMMISSLCIKRVDIGLTTDKDVTAAVVPCFRADSVIELSAISRCHSKPL